MILNDTLKVVESVSSEEDSDCGETYDNSLVVQSNGESEDAPTFGNVAVSNSTDIHFGNKTIYQGPVTIKKVLYSPPVTANNPAIIDEKISEYTKDNPVCTIERENPENHLSYTPTKSNKGNICAIKNRKKIVVILTIAIIVLISLIALVIVLLKNANLEAIRDSDEQDKRTPIDPLEPPVAIGAKLRLITRTEWLAKPPRNTLNVLSTPVPYVIICHTASGNCTDQATCTYFMKQIQSLHTDGRQWDDISYNFVVGGDGYAYEGRGWESEGAHTFGYNKMSIGIAFLGTFNDYLPPKRQIHAAEQLIKMGVEQGYISEDYKLLAARQLRPTQSPGKTLFENIKTWPHWSPLP